MNTSLSLDKQILKVTLRKLFLSNEYFDICTIDALEKLTRNKIATEIRNRMQVLHCVSYRDMDDDLKQWLLTVTVKEFSAMGMDISLDDVLPEKDTTPHKSLFARLIGG